jgi:3-isopropylmalate/(R)-2-methylmalate dehydratase small subunit
MLKFERLDAPAAPLDAPNVDTDQIIPARFLWRPRADGYGELLFNDLRTAEDGAPKPDFVLNRPENTNAKILVADRNFGCGSSREHAVWALLDAGIRVVVAPSFGDIFFNNALKNGLLPVVLPEARCTTLRAALRRAPGAHLSVDLDSQTISGPEGVNDGGGADNFEIDPFRKQLLLSGMDDITFTLNQADRISAFEARYRAETPWV